MNVLMLLAQGAMNMADSLATANPVLTPVSAPEMNMLDMAVKGGWIMIVLGVLSVVCFYILFERNYMIRKAGKEDPMFMERIKDYIHSGEIKAGHPVLPHDEHSFGTHDRKRNQPSGASYQRCAGCH